MKLVKQLSYDPEIYNDSKNKPGLMGSNIKTLLKTDKGEIIVITNKGVAGFNMDNYSVVNYSLIDNYISEFSYIYDDGNLTWLSSTSRFYNRDNKTGKHNWLNDELIKSNINPGAITYIYPDNKDKHILWLGGNGTGLVKYHKTKGVISTYLHDTNNKNSIISNNINCIIDDSFGNLWIGTNIGLSKLNIESETFKSYTTADGITNNFINSMLIDDNNNLWISTNKGLNKYSIKTNEFINFTDMDGLEGTEFNVNSSLKTSDGSMIFGSTDGLAYFNPNEIINPEKNKEKVVIDDIYEGENKIYYDGNEIILEHNYDDLSINYFLPNYRNINNVTYEYMLEGIDSKWIYADSKSYINYKSLYPGRYTFKVRARDVHGNLTEETSINIRVKNPIWKTPLAYFIYLIVLLVIIFLF
ncbi:triple tyrosine motif-containing protein [[Clostridium] dakarense]|uniref:triple tyrosine motif-containing protein n=1 Tax=Faecalimicrobium dakarense TaxID=1301100 RepID=UPI0004BC286B|nr:triple tyrosine motif-containing protein [[Clostridium] dakarense]